MKKFNSKFGIFGWLLFISVVAMGAKIGDNVLRIGDKTGSDILIEMGDNGQLKWDNAAQKLQFSNDGGSSLKEIGSGGGAASGVNLIENADFESGSPPSNWTASAGVFTANVGEGFDTQAGSWDSAAGSDTLDSDFQSVPLGLENRSCNTSIQYKYASGSGGDYKLQVIGNTAGLIAEKDLAVTSDWQKDALQFTCPSSDSIKTRITSTVDGGVILLDNATLGKTDFVSVSQTNLVARVRYPAVVNCTWPLETGGSFTSFPADTDCAQSTIDFSTVTVDNTEDDLPNIIFPNLPAGTYKIISHYQLSHNTSATNIGSRIWDGTTDIGQCAFRINNNGNEQSVTCTGVVTYSTSGARTFEIQGIEGQTGSMFLQNDFVGGELSFEVWRVPGSAAEAITLETTGYRADVSIDGAIVDLGTGGDITAYQEMSNAGLSMTTNPGNTADVEIPCSGTNPSTGLTCAAGDESLGIVLNDVPTEDDYEICMNFGHQARVNTTNTTMVVTFGIHKTPNNAQTLSITGDAAVQSGHGNSASVAAARDLHNPIRICETLRLDVGQNTIRLMRTQDVAGTPDSNNLLTDGAGGVSGGRKLTITVTKLHEQKPTPIFTDLTDSLAKRIKSDQNDLKIAAFELNNCGSSTTVGSDFGDAVASVADNGTGDCTVTWEVGYWTVAPDCAISGQDNLRSCASNGGTGTLTVRRWVSSTGASENGTCFAVCVGQ